MKAILKIPELETEAIPQRQCKYCDSNRVRIHGRACRPTRDLKVSHIKTIRMRCVECGKSFTVVPGGHEPKYLRSNRTRACGVALYCLGLSYPGVAAFLGGLGVIEGISTVYTDCQRSGQKARRLNRTQIRGVRVMGVDGTGQRVKGRGSEGVIAGVDLERGMLLEIDLISEDNPGEVREFIRGLVDRYGVEVIVTDEHRSYEGVEEIVEKGLCHYRCKTRFLRNKLRRVRELQKEMERRRWRRKRRDLAWLEERLRAGPLEEGDLEGLYLRYIKYGSPGRGRRYSLGYRVKLLLQELLEKANRAGLWSNNTTERIIGLALKFRSKTMRGFKKRENIKTISHLLFWLWQNRRDCNLALVL